MVFVRATPPRPVDATAVFPELTPLARAAIRLRLVPGRTHGWAPYEDQAAAFAAGHVAGQNPAQPTAVEVGSTDNLQLYVCPASPEHPHTDLIQ
ncbi:hypothetical protein ACFVYE_42440 [Streptomyces sp. NPDC058239]|uniref:hypothetical protein n=1 Tax=unclassified Streptomyces TaxID=2593676 RepID=UPI0036470F74